LPTASAYDRILPAQLSATDSTARWIDEIQQIPQEQLQEVDQDVSPVAHNVNSGIQVGGEGFPTNFIYKN